MASINTDVVRSYTPDIIPLPISFSLDAANGGTIVEGKKVVASVTRLAQGQFRIKLKDGWVAHMASSFSLQLAAAGSARWIQGKASAVTKSGGQTVDFRIVDAAGAEQDPPAAGANASVVSAVLWLRNTTVPS